MKNLLLLFVLIPSLGFSQLEISYISNDCPIEDILGVCVDPEPYAGFYKYETIYSWCGSEERIVTGEIEMTVNLRGHYYTEDFSFGTWSDCLGLDEGPSGTVEMQAVCTFISGIRGTDRYGNLWSSDNFTYENNSFTFNWFNSYGDFGTTTLTPIDGRILKDPSNEIENSDYDILWSTGEKTSRIKTNNSGLFEVTVTSIISGQSETASISIVNNEPTFKSECNGEILDVSYFIDDNKNGIQEIDEETLNVFESFIDFSPDYILKGHKSMTTERYLLEPQTYNWFVVNDSYATTLSNSTLTITEGPEIDILNVGLIIKEQIESLDVNIIATQLTRCETIVPFRIRAVNDGTLPNNGEFSVAIDPLLEIISYDIDPISEVDNLVTWQVDVANPTDYVDFTIYLKLPSSDYIGEIFCLAPITEASTKELNAYCFELSCAYDPNDKHGVPFRGGVNEILRNESLDYTIRFENLGNDTAFNINIVDQLNLNYNIRSFEMKSASHEITSYWIDTDRQLHVEFENIQLPSIEQDSILNKGYFTFSIDLLPGLPENTKINNKASIYFDQNDPIVTNTTTHTLVSQLATTSIATLENTDFYLSPNPVQALLNVNFESSVIIDNTKGSIEVHDVSGKLVLVREKLSNSLDVSQLETGVYFLRIQGNEGNFGTAKFVKI